jgi:hypothetical protein
MTNDQQQQPYTLPVLAEAARQGGRPVTLGTLARHCRDGKLQAHKVQGTWTITPSDAQLWLIEWLSL